MLVYQESTWWNVAAQMKQLTAIVTLGTLCNIQVVYQYHIMGSACSDQDLTVTMPSPPGASDEAAPLCDRQYGGWARMKITAKLQKNIGRK